MCSAYVAGTGRAQAEPLPAQMEKCFQVVAVPIPALQSPPRHLSGCAGQGDAGAEPEQGLVPLRGATSLEFVTEALCLQPWAPNRPGKSFLMSLCCVTGQ